MLESVRIWIRDNWIIREILFSVFRKYIKLIASPKEKEIVIVSPYGMGDTYILCLLAEQICDTYGVESIIMVVIKPHNIITEMFPTKISKVVTIDKIGRRFINRLYISKKERMIIDSRDKQSLKILAIKNVDLFQFIKVNLVITSNSKILKPKISEFAKKSAKVFFETNNLIYGKTVILFPNANSISKLTLEFWNELAKQLSNLGYSTCTNIVNESDSIIENTRPINIPLEFCIPIAEFAGGIISIRSGICDLLSTANTKLVVLYPTSKIIARKTPLECYSLNSMNLSGTAIEYEVNEHDFIYKLDEIIKCFY